MLSARSISFPDEFGNGDLFFMFPEVWRYVAYLGGWLCFFFLGFLAVLLISMEHNHRTLRQNIINGLTRKEFVLGKIGFIITISLLATIYYILVCLVIGFFNTQTVYMSEVTDQIMMIPRYFLMCFGYMSFGLMVGSLIKRTGIALFVYIAYTMFIELFLRYGIHMKMFGSNKTVHYYPLNAIEDLTPMPIMDMAKNFMRENGFEMSLSPTEAIVISCIWILIFLTIVYNRFIKSDL